MPPRVWPARGRKVLGGGRRGPVPEGNDPQKVHSAASPRHLRQNFRNLSVVEV